MVSAQSKLAYKFGVSFGDALVDLTATEIGKRLDDLVLLGLGWIRFDMAWNDVQPDNSTSYNWSNLDRIVAAADTRHIKMLPVLTYTPRWARISGCSSSNNGKCAPADPALFATFVQVAVKRYATRGISTWEIWNEPNLEAFWKPAPNPVEYATLLKATYGAIKSQEPNAIVVTGGMGPAATKNGDIAPLEFLAELYHDGAGGYFDAVGFHPYSYPAMPSYVQSWNAWSQMSDTNPSLRSIMTMNGDAGKQIWLTEYGAPTGGPGSIETSSNDRSFTGDPRYVTEGLQAEMLTDAVKLTERYSWAGPLFWYSYQDLGTSNNTAENFFGLIRFDGSLKPAYNTLKQLLSGTQ